MAHMHRVTIVAIGILVGLSFHTAIAANTVYFAQNTSNFPLDTEGDLGKVLTLTVPKGSWVITAKASPVNFSNPAQVNCFINVNGAPKDEASATVGIPSSLTETMITVYAVKVTVAATITLTCGQDLDAPGGAQSGVYLDGSSDLAAVEASSLNVQ